MELNDLWDPMTCPYCLAKDGTHHPACAVVVAREVTDRTEDLSGLNFSEAKHLVIQAQVGVSRINKMCMALAPEIEDATTAGRVAALLREVRRLYEAVLSIVRYV